MQYRNNLLDFCWERSVGKNGLAKRFKGGLLIGGSSHAVCGEFQLSMVDRPNSSGFSSVSTLIEPISVLRQLLTRRRTGSNRLYGPLEPWFDKSWRPSEIELIP